MLWDQICEVVKAWHGAVAFEIYRDHAPEMQRIKAAVDRLQGERGVLMDLLRECHDVIETIEGESTDETAQLRRLLGHVKRITMIREGDADLLTTALQPGQSRAGSRT